MNKEHVWTFNEFHKQSVCETCNRIAAFGAIRRAAEIARYCDHEAGRAFPVNPPKTAEEARLRLLPAKAIRQAIRAAIGSDKA